MKAHFKSETQPVVRRYSYSLERWGFMGLLIE